jgi:glycosyltransferase involved in cell wall biosynthesis
MRLRHAAVAEVSVVVSTYERKRWHDLSSCLEALRRQSSPPLEVIVVVDHNPSLLLRTADEFPWARVVANRHTRGLAGARNTGADLARAPIIAFVDDDAVPESEWLERLTRAFAGPDVAGAGGRLVPRWQDGAPGWFPSEFYWVVGCSYTGLPERPGPVRNPIGANMAVRSEVLRAVGGFREASNGQVAPRVIRARGAVRGGGNVPDDTDLAIRVSQQWPEAVWFYQPEATVHHTVTRGRASFSYFLRRSFEEGLCKASLTHLVGKQAGLASERRQAAVVLPRGVLRELRRLLAGDGSAALRALAIVIGMTSATAGYLGGSLAGALRRRKMHE